MEGQNRVYNEREVRYQKGGYAQALGRRMVHYHIWPEVQLSAVQILQMETFQETGGGNP